MSAKKTTKKKKGDGVGMKESSLFKDLKMSGFSEEEIEALSGLFSVLANDKRLDILEAAIVNKTTRLKDLADELGEKNSAQIALHAKKLHDAGLLKKEGASLRDSRAYVPTIAKETYAFLKLASRYAAIVNACLTELQLGELKTNAELAEHRIASSPLAAVVSFSELPTQYEAPLNAARELFRKSVKDFAKLINITEL